MLRAHSFRTPSSIVGDRAFCRGQLCGHKNSPYSGQLYHDIDLLCRDIISPCLDQNCRDLKILCHDRESSQSSQLCHNIELPCCNTKPLHLAILYHDIKTLCHEGKLLAWPTLSQHRNTLSRHRTPGLDQLCHDTKCYVTTQGPLVLATLYRDIEYSISTQFLGFLSRHYISLS